VKRAGSIVEALILEEDNRKDCGWEAAGQPKNEPDAERGTIILPRALVVAFEPEEELIVPRLQVFVF
jgi:hypothetical protein